MNDEALEEQVQAIIRRPYHRVITGEPVEGWLRLVELLRSSSATSCGTSPFRIPETFGFVGGRTPRRTIQQFECSRNCCPSA